MRRLTDRRVTGRHAADHRRLIIARVEQLPDRRTEPRHSLAAASASGTPTATEIRSTIAGAAWNGNPHRKCLDAITWQPRYRGLKGRQTGSFASPSFDGFALFH